MKFSSTLVALVFVCFALVACGKPVEEKALAAATNSKDAEIVSKMLGVDNVPDCAKNKADGTPVSPNGCTRAQWAEWHKTH